MSIQKTIDKMKSGNILEIKRSISSETPILIMNSLIFGVKNNLSDNNYIEEVKKVCSNNTSLMGFQTGSVAKAALSILTGTEYIGDDSVTKALIENNFNF